MVEIHVCAGHGTARTVAAATHAAWNGVGLGHVTVAAVTGTLPAGTIVTPVPLYPQDQLAVGDLVPAIRHVAAAAGAAAQVWAAIGWVDLGERGVRFVTVDGDNRGQVEDLTSTALVEIAEACGHTGPVEPQLRLAGGSVVHGSIAVVVAACLPPTPVTPR